MRCTIVMVIQMIFMMITIELIMKEMIRRKTSANIEGVGVGGG